MRRLSVGEATVAVVVSAACGLSMHAGGVSPQATSTSTPNADMTNEMYYADAVIHGANIRAGSSPEPGRMVAMVATDLGRSIDIAKTLEEDLGAEILFHDRTIDYIRLALPVTRWNQLRGVSNIAASSIERGTLGITWREKPTSLSSLVRRHYRVSSPPSGEKPPLIEPPHEAPSMALRAVSRTSAKASSDVEEDPFGMARLRAEHPSFDGRGVTIAILESTSARAEVDHALLSTPALDIHGAPQAKILGVSPFADDEDRVIREFREFSATESIFWRHGGSGIVLPKPGRYRLGTAEVDGVLYAVLWAPLDRTAWVDINQDGSFADESTVRLGDVPQVIRSTTGPGWAAQGYFLTTANNSVTLHRLGGGHATMSASVAAGSRSTGYLAVGVAPAARLFLVESGETVHEVLESLITAARRPEVDVISISTTAPLSVPESDEQLTAIVINRIVTEYRKLVVHAAGNLSRVEHAAPSGSLALSVGAMISQAALKRFYDRDTTIAETVWDYSERGPSLLGILKPDIVAPAEWLSAEACRGQHKTGFKRLSLPPCHTVSGGTSAAAPSVAGLAATLISAGRQTGKKFSPIEIRNALVTSARLLSGARPVDQGFGLPQADRAWAGLLGPRPDEVEVAAPVSHTLNQSDNEQGLYLREGWRAGQHGTVSIRLRRTSGSAAQKSYVLRLHGDRQTFKAAAGTQLALGRLTLVPIEIDTGDAGIKSAILDLVESGTGVIARRIPLTVVAAQPLMIGGPPVVIRKTLAPAERIDYAFAVPQGTAALAVSLKRTCATLVSLFEPGGWQHYRTDTLPPAVGATARDDRMLIPDPMPGTWIATAFRTNEVCGTAAAELTAAFSTEHAAATVDESHGRPIRVDVATTGLLAVRAYLGRTETYNNRDSSPSVVDVIQIDIGEDHALLQVSKEERDRSTGVYLYDCTGSVCYRFAALPAALHPRSLSIGNPRRGRWALVRVSSMTTNHDKRLAAVRVTIATEVPLLCRDVPLVATDADRRQSHCLARAPSRQAADDRILILAAAPRQTTSLAPNMLLAPLDKSNVNVGRPGRSRRDH